jgi:hypothetical protein
MNMLLIMPSATFTFRRNAKKKKKDGEELEESADLLALDQSSDKLVVAEAPTTGSPSITIIESLDGSLTSVTASSASSMITSTAVTTVITTTAIPAADPLSIIETADKSVDGDSETPLLSKESEDPASPSKSLSESSAKAAATPKKPKRDRKPKVKAIFPGKRNIKYVCVRHVCFHDLRYLCMVFALLINVQIQVYIPWGF